MKAPDTAFNVALMVLDDMLGKSVPIEKALILAGNKILELNKQSAWFDGEDLRFALESIDSLNAAHCKDKGFPPPPRFIRRG